MAGPSQRIHVTWLVYQEQMWWRPHLRPSRPYRGPLSAWIFSLVVRRVRRARYYRQLRIHVNDATKSETCRGSQGLQSAHF